MRIRAKKGSFQEAGRIFFKIFYCFLAFLATVTNRAADAGMQTEIIEIVVDAAKQFLGITRFSGPLRA